MRRCQTFIGLAAPHKVPIESTIVHNATQTLSTDPKNSGARLSAAIVTQSWIDLIACTEAPIAARKPP
jgi:hypothetical protein